MGEILTVEDIRRSSWREDLEERQNYEYERQGRELAKEHEQQQARKAREAETASTNWYAAVDGRIHEHLANWLWAAIDQRVTQILEQHFFSGKRGVGGAVIGGLTDAVGGLVGKLKHAIEEQRRAFEAKLVALEERQALSNQAIEAHQRDVAGGAQLRAEVKRAIEETVDAFGGQLAELEQRLRAVPGRLPVAKTWRPESVSYQAEFVAHEGSLY